MKALRMVAILGVIVAGKILIERMNAGVQVDTSWVPQAISDGKSATWLPPGWRKSLTNYACLGVYQDGRGKVTYLCRPR